MKHRKTTPIPTRPTDRGLSALGQKPTFAVQNGMSALHLKADMCGAMRDVRFVPKADIDRPFDILKFLDICGEADVNEPMRGIAAP
jgi:hypothetical protein